jgi:hypothetical protein
MATFDEAQYDRRYVQAVQRLTPTDVIAEVASILAQLVDPQAHPLAGVIAYYLQAGGPDTGQRPWNLEALAADYDRLVREALHRLIAVQLGED